MRKLLTALASGALVVTLTAPAWADAAPPRSLGQSQLERDHHDGDGDFRRRDDRDRDFRDGDSRERDGRYCTSERDGDEFRRDRYCDWDRYDRDFDSDGYAAA